MTPPLTVPEVCRALGLSRRSFYRCQDELRRRGLVELPPFIRTRRFDAESVARVRLSSERTPSWPARLAVR
jgi:predicted DNA-binding transcriptional regulator AlpA